MSSAVETTTPTGPSSELAFFGGGGPARMEVVTAAAAVDPAPAAVRG